VSEVSFPGVVILRRIGGLLPGGRLLRLSVSLLVLITVLAPATAEAVFKAPVYLSEPYQNAEEPQVAIDNNGNGLAVWERFDGANFRIQARTRSASGVLGSVQDLSAAGQSAFSPQVAVNGNGNALVVWTRFNGLCQCDKIQARTLSSAGVLGAVQDLSAGGQNAEVPQVGIDANGNALAVWQRFDGTNDRVQARTRSSAGVLGAVQTLSDAGRNAFSPQVAVNAAGAGLVDWTRFDGLNDRIQARTLSASGVLGSVQDLSAALQDAEEPQVAIDAGGNALAVWERFDGANFLIEARTLSAAGVLGSVLTLSAAGQPAFSPQVAVNGNGNGLVDWTRFNGLCACDKTQARPVSSAGVLGSVQDLSAGGQNAEQPQVGIDANGKGVAVWATDKIQARTRSASGVLGKVQTLSASGAFSPQVAVNGAGAALVDWTRSGFVDRTQAAAGP